MLWYKATLWCIIDVFLCNWRSQSHITLKILHQSLLQSVENIIEMGNFMLESYLSFSYTGDDTSSWTSSITPGIQKHVTVLNTRNGDILRSGNIKGGMFWCLHINTFEDVSTRDVHIYLEHNFWDNSMKFHILMWYIKLIIQFYYFGFLFLVMLSVLTN